MNLDWKYLLSALLALAGVAVPILLWKTDQSAYSIGVRVVASTDLRVKESRLIPELTMRVGDQVIESPHITTIEIANDGARPIPASAFEGPLEILSSEAARVVRATVMATVPADLPVKYDLLGGVVTFQPLLLNPQDAITVSVLTSGAKPSFNARARIAGVSRIQVDDVSVEKKRRNAVFLYYPAGFILVVFYFVFTANLINPDSFRLSRPVTILLMFSMLVGGLALWRQASAIMSFDLGETAGWLFLAVPSLIGLVVGFLLSKRSRSR